MGFRFRKSIKIAPGLKINLNKNSVSATVGTRGAHYTINSKGKKTASVGIPGTGLSYTTTSGASSSKSLVSSSMSRGNTNKLLPNDSEPNNEQKWYQKTVGIIAMLILFFPVGLFLMWKYADWSKKVKIGISAVFAIALIIPSSSELEKISLKADTSQSYDINEKILIEYTTEPADFSLTASDFEKTGGSLQVSDGKIYFSSLFSGTYEIYAENSGVKSNTLTIIIEDKEVVTETEGETQEAPNNSENQTTETVQNQTEPATQQQSVTQQNNSATVQQPAENTPATESEEPTVYITNTGDKYHRAGCRYLKDSKIEKKLSEVTGKAPCGVCNPPTQ